MAKPTEDYWITVRFKSNGVKERTLLAQMIMFYYVIL